MEPSIKSEAAEESTPAWLAAARDDPAYAAIERILATVPICSTCGVQLLRLSRPDERKERWTHKFAPLWRGHVAMPVVY